MTTLDYWGELDELAAALDSFAETPPGAYFGVDLMRASLEQRRAELVDAILSHQPAVEEQLDISLEGAGATNRGVRVSVLAELLDELQEALAAIAMTITRGPRRLRVSSHIRELVALRVAVALPGSLAVRLVAADSTLGRAKTDLLGEHPSVLEQSADRLVAFLQTAGDVADPVALDAVGQIGPRGAARIQRLATVIAKSETETRLRWSSPRLTREARLDASTAGRLATFLDSLDEQEYSVSYDGRLLGGSLLRGRFELALPSDQVVTGTVEETVLPLLQQFFGRACRAEVVVTVFSTPGGLTRESRTLVGLTELDDA